MSESLGSSVLDLSTDDSGLQRGLSDAEGTVKSRMSRMGGAIAKATKIAAASFAAAGAAAIAAAFRTAAYGDEIAKTAPKLGITTDALQEMNYWAERNGVSSSNLERAVGRLNQRLGDGQAEGNKYVQALNGIGVATLDANGKVRDTESVMRDTIEALRGIEDPSIRSSAAADIFGTKMARDLMPALQDTSLSLEEATERARELGLVMDSDALAAAERFTDGWADIKDQIAFFIRDAAAPLMAWMADSLFPAISNGIVILRGLFETFREGDGVIDGFRNLLSGIADAGPGLFERLVEGVQTVIGNLVNWLSTGGAVQIVNGILAARERIFTAAITVIGQLLEAAVEILPQLVQWLAGTGIPMVVDLLVSQVPMLLMAAVTLFSTLLDALVEVIPPLLATLLGELLPNLLTSILGMVPDLLEAALAAFMALVFALVDIIPVLLATLLGDVLPALLTTILDMVPDLLGAAVETFFALVLGLVQVLPDLIRTLIGEVLPNLIVTLLGMIPQLLDAAITTFLALVKAIIEVLPELLRVIAAEVGPALFQAIIALGRQLFDAGANIVGQIADGIRSAIGKVVDAAKAVVGRIRDFLPFSPAKEGPFKVTPPDVLGAKISSMLADGIESVDVGASVAHSLSDVNLRTSASSRAIRLDVDGRTLGEVIVDMLQMQNELNGPVALAVK